MNIKKLIEEINKLSEEDVNEVTLQDEIEPAEPAEVIEPEKPAFNDNTTPYDFASTPTSQPTTDVSNDPFADFGSSIEISDDELPF